MLRKQFEDLWTFGHLESYFRASHYLVWLFICPANSILTLPPKVKGLIICNERVEGTIDTYVGIGLIRYGEYISKDDIIKAISPFYLGTCNDEEAAKQYFKFNRKNQIGETRFFGVYEPLNRVVCLDTPRLYPINQTENSNDEKNRREINEIKAFFATNNSKREFYEINPSLALKWSSYIDLLLSEKINNNKLEGNH